MFYDLIKTSCKSKDSILCCTAARSFSYGDNTINFMSLAFSHVADAKPPIKWTRSTDIMKKLKSPKPAYIRNILDLCLNNRFKESLMELTRLYKNGYNASEINKLGNQITLSSVIGISYYTHKDNYHTLLWSNILPYNYLIIWIHIFIS